MRREPSLLVLAARPLRAAHPRGDGADGAELDRGPHPRRVPRTRALRRLRVHRGSECWLRPLIRMTARPSA